MTRVFFGNFNLDQEAADHGSWPSHPFLSLDHARLWQKATKRTQKTKDGTPAMKALPPATTQPAW